MPISATMSLWGLYRYDDTILDGLTVPTGMDSNNLKQNLLIETASLEILYPDPDFLKVAISLWAAERKDVWDKLYETTQLQYNPIENYDRMEESEEQNTGSASSETSGTTTNSTAQNINRSGNSEATNSNTAYNSNTFSDTAKTEAENSDNTSGITTGNEQSNMRGNAVNTGNRKFSSHIHGNIGVKTAMAMIMEQRDVAQFCMQEYIINDFIQRFCVMVY